MITAASARSVPGTLQAPAVERRRTLNFRPFLACLGLFAAGAAPAQQPARAPAVATTSDIDGDLRRLVQPVSEERLRRDIDKLVSFGTRHTLSSQTNPRRGIGAALRWTEAEFRRIGRACGDCLFIAKPSDTVTGRRVPNPTLVTNVLAIQRGTTDPNRVIILSGHIDSRVSDVMDATKDAPGANDDGSGTALVIEAARVLSKHKFPATIVYAVLSGEEQGLLGGRILADYAKAQGWAVEANLNNDIVGNSCGSDGVCDPGHVRVFSEGPRWQGGVDIRGQLRSLGGENDSPSRNLSRFIDEVADGVGVGLDVRPIWRNDRFGRGGDHTELLNAGYPAIRFSVAVEDYDHQHQDLRVEDGRRYGDTADEMDFAYLTRVTRLNSAVAAALARAPAVPAPTVEGAVSTDTTLTWPGIPGATAYTVRWRRTDAAPWQQSATHPAVLCGSPDTAATPCRFTLPGIRVDDWIFGVSAVGADGYQSPAAAAVPGGAFRPLDSPAQPASGSQ